MNSFRSVSATLLLLSSLLAAACGSSEGNTRSGSDGGTSGSTDGGSDSEPDPACEATQFEAVASYDLPAGDFPMPADAVHCSYTGNRSDRSYSLIDIDGDDLADIVLTGDCSDGADAALGATHWSVYKNQDGAFAQAATSFAIPPGGFPTPSDADHCSYTGNRSDRTYALLDIDGDDLPDLVVTSDCTEGGDDSLGRTHWNVYKNQGNAFAQSATRFDLPPGDFPMPSDAEHCSYTGNRSDRTYSLTDMDGDALPDLVLTGDCTDTPEANLGETHWNVYKNQGNGFAQTAARYELPLGTFPMPADAGHCSYIGNRTNRTYGLFDIDADALPDLVVTGDCRSEGDDSLGETHWNVYKNAGGTFSQEATSYALPSGGFPMPADSVHCSYIGNRSNRTYSLVDVNRDALPDLVVTHDCTSDGDDTLGESQWSVYKNLDGRFSESAEALAIPQGGFPMTSDADQCGFTGNRSNRTFGFTDISGDRLPDLVLTNDCTDGGDDALGSVRWDVYQLSCSE